MLTLGEKLLIIRQTYNIKPTLMAKIMDVYYRNYQRYEKDENEPNISKLVNLADVLGISIDWLAGRSISPYNEDVLNQLEERLFFNSPSEHGMTISIKLMKHNSVVQIFPLPNHIIPEQYADKTLRRKHYNLSIRAGILFLLHIYCSKIIDSDFFLTLPSGDTAFDYEAAFRDPDIYSIISNLKQFNLGINDKDNPPTSWAKVSLTTIFDLEEAYNKFALTVPHGFTKRVRELDKFIVSNC